MASDQNTYLVVGKVPGRIVVEFMAGRPAAVERVASVGEARRETYDAVFRRGPFEGFSFAGFADELAALRSRVAVGGALIFTKKPRSARDDIFVFRTDGFFLTELPETGRADFERIEVRTESRLQVVTMAGRVTGEAAAARLAALPHDSLAWIHTVNGSTPTPNWIWMASTTRCNIRCRTCSIRYDTAPGRDMAPEVIDKVFAELNDTVDVVNVTGIGEPIFSRNWPQLYGSIRGKTGRTLEIVSNGILLKEDLVRDMMRPENPTFLLISIDGATKETYEYIRDRGKWDRVVEAMEMIRRVREEMKPGEHFRLGVDFVAVKDNVHELPEFVRCVAEWGVDWLIVIEMGDWITNREYFQEQALRFHPELANKYYALAREEAEQRAFSLVSIPPDYSAEVIEASRRAADDNAPGRDPRLLRFLRAANRFCQATPRRREAAAAAVNAVARYAERAPGMPGPLGRALRRQAAIANYDTLGDFRRVRGYCSIVHERAYFHANGNVSSCCGLPEPVFGNIMEKDFSGVWQSPKYREFRVMNLLGFPHAGCYLCTLPYGLPAKNPGNFIAAHQVRDKSNLLARVMRKAKALLAAPAASPVVPPPAARQEEPIISSSAAG